MLDDLFTYRLDDDRFLTVTNASNHESDLAWFRRHAGDFDLELIDRINDFAMLALQGPAARAHVGGVADGELPAASASASCGQPAFRRSCAARDRDEGGARRVRRRPA